MMNRLKELFRKKNNILSIFFTAGYPNLNDTEKIIVELEKNGADLIEIGIPFSDPVADGTIIQGSNKIALQNGMSLRILFDQLKNIREKVNIPLVLMGYINPVMQYGIENFCKKMKEIGIDGAIIPDLPLNIYVRDYENIFKKYNVSNIQLITPYSSNERIMEIDKKSNSFIYMVSTATTTGTKSADTNILSNFSARLNKLNLQSHRLIGFGISDKKSFNEACKYADGAIIGSAFISSISTLSKDYSLEKNIKLFVDSIIH